ncbi:MAG TPA: hypothetical protein VH590_18350, partial [Ktedonobacterales bacterium]
MAPKQIAEALDKNVSTVKTLLARLLRDGDVKMTRFAKYTSVNPVVVVGDVVDSPLKKEKKEITLL